MFESEDRMIYDLTRESACQFLDHFVGIHICSLSAHVFVGADLKTEILYSLYSDCIF